MGLQFPTNQPNGTTWEPTPNPYNLVFEYDDSTNSWNIVGPDNIATTDYVDAQLSDSSSDVIRNYHLHTSVNSVSITANFTYQYNDTDLGDPHNSQGNINEDTHCDYIFSSGVQGRVLIDNESVTQAIAAEIDDWHKCMESYTSKGQFKVVGVDVENGYVTSYKYKDICGFNFSAYDKDNEVNNWFEEANVGDVIEVNYDSGSSGTPRYAIYQILDIQELKTYNDHRYGVSVQFLESATPDTEFRTNAAGTHYQFRNYLQPLNSGGGTLSGDLKIVSDSNQALSVWRNEDEITNSNPHNLLLKVDTTNNKLLSSKQYDKALRTPSHVDDELLVTLNHLNTRLGIEDPIYTTQDNGPFLAIRGGTMTGTLIINRSSSGSGASTFIVKGKNTSQNIINLFYVYKDSGGDSVRYNGRITNNKDIVTKEFVDSEITALDNKVTNSKYLKKNSSGDSNKMTTDLNFGTKTGINVNMKADPKDNDIANVGYVKSKMSGLIHNGYTPTKGLLYTEGGSLYFNNY